MAPVERALQWTGGSLGELISVLSAAALPARIEVKDANGGGAGELHLLAGSVDQVQAGALRGEDALAVLHKVQRPTFLVETRLPHPETGSLAEPVAEDGSLSDRSLVKLMRYCEDYVLTCRLDVRRGGDRASLSYRRGELVSTSVNGSDTNDRLPEVLAWDQGSFRISLPPPVLPPSPEVTPPPVTAGYGRSATRRSQATLPLIATHAPSSSAGVPVISEKPAAVPVRPPSPPAPAKSFAAPPPAPAPRIPTEPGLAPAAAKAEPSAPRPTAAPAISPTPTRTPANPPAAAPPLAAAHSPHETPGAPGPLGHRPRKRRRPAPSGPVLRLESPPPASGVLSSPSAREPAAGQPRATGPSVLVAADLADPAALSATPGPVVAAPLLARASQAHTHAPTPGPTMLSASTTSSGTLPSLGARTRKRRLADLSLAAHIAIGLALGVAVVVAYSVYFGLPLP